MMLAKSSQHETTSRNREGNERSNEKIRIRSRLGGSPELLQKILLFLTKHASFLSFIFLSSSFFFSFLLAYTYNYDHAHYTTVLLDT